MVRNDDLRARQRLRGQVAGGYRRSRQERPGAGDDRNARTRCRTECGAGAAEGLRGSSRGAPAPRPNSAGPPTSAGAIRRRASSPSRSANRRRRIIKAPRRGCMRRTLRSHWTRRRSINTPRWREFKQVRAPFDGTITERKIDIGNLVTAGSTSTTTPLYRMAQTDPLRVFVDVPQNAAGELMKPGVPAEIRVDGTCRGRHSPGKLPGPPNRSMRRLAPCAWRSTCPMPIMRCFRGRM